MTWRYLGLSLIITVISLAAQLSHLVIRLEPVPQSWLTPPGHEDPEGRLALGLKLSLACADMWSLELLKGVSDTLAFELLEKRDEILRASRKESESSALQRAHGVGEKKAQALLKHLSLKEQCSNDQPYSEWPPE